MSVYKSFQQGAFDVEKELAEDPEVHGYKYQNVGIDEDSPDFDEEAYLRGQLISLINEVKKMKGKS